MKTHFARSALTKRTYNHVSAPIGAWLLLSTLLFVAFWIRIQSVDTIPDGQFTSNDAYLYYWQAQIVSEQGFLPSRDMHRWVPLGRDLKQMLPLYSYAVAYAYKPIRLLFPNVLLYHVMLFAPVVCFVIGLGVLCLYLYRVFGILFSGTVGVLLATLPGTIERSTAGFSDRDSWCLMLGILTITTYLASLQATRTRGRILWTIASGLSVFLGGLSWEGFGVFVLVILFVELWRFLTSDTEARLGQYFLWTLTFIPTLFLASPAYRSGEGFAKHLFAFILMPPLALLFLRYLRHLLITKEPLAARLRPHTRILALGLTLTLLTGGIFYFLSQLDTFALSTVPLSQNRLMQSVGELSDPEYRQWVFRYGSIFFLGCIGLIMTSIHLWEQRSLILIFPLAFFTGTTFFRDRLETLLTDSLSNTLFFASIVCAVLGFLLTAWWRNEHAKNELASVAFAVWLLCYVAIARNAIRYDFFIGIPIAFFTATLLQLLSETLCAKLNIRRQFPQTLLKTSITVVLLAILMYWTPAGAHAKRSIFVARHIRKATPGHAPTEKAFRWMKAHLPNTACVAASWGDGSQLNVLGGVKTIIDQDHYIQHWIHLFYRHVYCAQSDEEALEFLKTHRATHLMLTSQDLFQFARIHTSIGSDAQGDRLFELIPLQMPIYQGGRAFLVPVDQNTPFARIDINQNTGGAPLITTIATLKNKSTVEMPYTAFIGKTRIHNRTGVKIGGVLLLFNARKQFRIGYYVPLIGWNSLAMRLFFRGESPEVFVPVYPTDEDITAGVKVWEIRYPPDIKTNPEYLATDPPRDNR